jgi:hypothetical protein
MVGLSHVDWTYVALPTSELFRMSFAELVKSMRQALVFLQRCIPEAERILRHSGGENGGATSLVRLPKKCFYDPPILWADLNSLVRMGKRAQLAIGLLRGRLGAPHVRAGSFDRFANANKPVTAECDRMTESDGEKYDVYFCPGIFNRIWLNWFVRGDGATVLEYCMS